MLHVFKITDFVWLHTENFVKYNHLRTSCSVWGMTSVAHVVAGKLHMAPTCHFCFTSVFLTLYIFSFFRCKQLTHYLKMVRWHQLNKIWLSIPLFCLSWLWIWRSRKFKYVELINGLTTTHPAIGRNKRRELGSAFWSWAVSP